MARLLRAMRSSRRAAAGVLLLALFTLIAVFPGLIPHDSPTALAYPPDAGPSSAHWLGTTNVGQDVFAQVVVGTRPVVVLAVAVGALTTITAMLIGVAAAYYGGLWDSILNLVTDVMLVIPLFPLLMIIAGYLHDAGTTILILVLTFTGWSYTARQLRSQAQSLRNRDFLLAARVRGERPVYIICVEIIPTMTSLLVASFLGNALYAVLAGSGLQFLGLGDADSVSWGSTLYSAQQYDALQNGLYLWAIVPGLCIALLGAAFALINYAFDEIGNPALRPMRREPPKRGRLARRRRRVLPSPAPGGA